MPESGVFPSNCWYIAGWSDEVAERPLARTIAGLPMVLFRAGGAVAALEDRCCHRSLPLSLGKIVGAHLQCGYHGLEFDTTGACVRVPGQGTVPPGARVPHYSVAERWGLIWVWPGEAQADPALIPDFHWFDSPGWVAPHGYFHVKTNYLRIIDNLLDFNHLQFVHLRTIGNDAIADIPSKTRRTDHGLEQTRWVMDRPPPPLFQRAGGFNGNVDRWMNVNYTLPSNCVFDIGCAAAGTGAPEGDRSKGIEIRSMHAISPETATTAHYFWGYGRNFKIDDAATTELLRTGARATFTEDVELLEAQAAAYARIGDRPEIDIMGDAAPLQARRMVDEMIARDAQIAA
jgi:vanillate O-demethylase monooxygenase subunit